MTGQPGTPRSANWPPLVAILVSIFGEILVLTGVTRMSEGSPFVIGVPALGWIPQFLLFGGLPLRLTAIIVAVASLALASKSHPSSRVLGWWALAITSVPLALWLIAAV